MQLGLSFKVTVLKHQSCWKSPDSAAVAPSVKTLSHRYVLDLSVLTRGRVAQATGAQY